MSDKLLRYLVGAASICIVARTSIEFFSALVPNQPPPTRKDQAKHMIREACKQFKNDDLLYATCWSRTHQNLKEQGFY